VCQVKDKFKKIISVILVLVTLLLTFTIPALAKSTNYANQSSRFIGILSFIENSNNKVIVYNQAASPLSLDDYYVDDSTFLPFVTTNMKNLYVFCNDSSSALSDSLININPDFNFKQLVVYLDFSTYAPTGSDIDFNLSMYSPYYDKLRIQLINEDKEVIKTVQTGSGPGRQFYDSKAYTLFNGLGLKNHTWHSDYWAYGVNSGKGIYIRETNINLHHEMQTAEHLYGVKLIFDIGSYQSNYWFNFNTCKISLDTPGSGGYTDELKQYIEYTDSLWDNVLIFFKNCGIFFENMLTQSINFFTSLPTKLSTWFTNVINGIRDLPDNIKGFFTTLGDRIGNFFEKLVDSVKGDFRDSFLGKIITLIDKIKSVITGADAHAYSVIDLDSDGSSDSSEDTSSGDWDINQKYMQPFNYDYWKVGE